MILGYLQQVDSTVARKLTIGSHRINTSPVTVTDIDGPVSQMFCTQRTRANLYFAQVREDPLVELDYFSDLTRGRFFVIASGGCTALSLLLLKPLHVIAVDNNPAQEALVGIKIAALSQLNHDELWGFLGISPCQDRWEIYTKLRHGLSDEHRIFWDMHPDWIRSGIHYAGKTERFYSALSRLLRIFVHPESRIRQLLSCRDLESQRRFYESTWCSFRWRMLFKLCLSRPLQLLVFGRTAFPQSDEDSFADYFYSVTDRAFRQIPIRSNYFISQILLGEYLQGPQGAPPYLIKDNHEVIRDHLHAMTLKCAAADTALANESPGSIDGFALSNIFDWQTEKEREQICREILRTGKHGAKIVYRNLVSSPPLPTFFEKAVEWDDNQSRDYHRRDRAFMYKQLRVGRIARPKR